MSEEKKSEILTELESLGQQLAAAVKSLWESEESRNLRRDLAEGFATLGKELDSAVKTAQDSDAARQFGQQVKETVEKARASDAAAKVEHGLITGLRELNEGIAKLIDSLQEDKPAAAPPDEPAGEAEV
jgi:hypothetical protein